MTMRPQRWLILTQYYPPEMGAPQIRLRSAVREMKRHGVDVRVLTALPNYPAGKIHPGYEGRWVVREVIDDVPVTRTWVYAATGKVAHLRLANYFSFTFSALLAALFGPRVDVLFVESQPLSLGLVALAMKWLRGTRYVYNVPDLQVDVARQMGFMTNRAALRLASALETLFLKQAWKVATVTQGFIKHCQDRGVPRDRITFLPNGADSEFLRPQPPSAALSDRWGLAGRKVFLYVGTHAFYHGLETLIEAATLLRDVPDICFLMIGNGPERPRLMQMAQDRGLTNVVFGSSPYEEMDQLYSVGWASVATLRNIAVAQTMRLSKIFPSLSCGVPVIYSGFGEAAELLDKEACGLTVAPERPDLLAAAVRRLAADEPLRSQMGQRGRAMVERDYSWSAIVQRWLAHIGVARSSATLLPNNADAQ